MKYKIKPKFNILIKEIQDEKAKNIEKKIKENNDPSLTYLQKKIKVLSEEKTTTFIYETYDINIKKIQEEQKNRVNQKIAEINDSNLNENQKLLFALRQDKTTTYRVSEMESPEKIEKPKYKVDIDAYNKLDEKRIKKIAQEKYNNLNLSDKEKYLKALEDDMCPTIDLREEFKDLNKSESKIFIYEEDNNEPKQNETDLSKSINATRDKSLNDSKNIYINDTEDYSIEEEYLNKSFSVFSELKNQTITESIENKKKNCFIPARAQFYLKYELDDILLINTKVQNILIPKIYEINEEKNAFVYSNNLNTYYITESHCIFNHKEKNKLDEIDKTDEKFHKKLGLYFCGKQENVPTKNGRVIKTCEPNNFMCKDCMEKNKRIYSLKKNYLININGRVSKKNKGNYHCFGRYLINNSQIEDCITTFSCKACRNLEDYEKYYFI